jgi:hypothetical protein
MYAVPPKTLSPPYGIDGTKVAPSGNAENSSTQWPAVRNTRSETSTPLQTGKLIGSPDGSVPKLTFSIPTYG